MPEQRCGARDKCECLWWCGTHQVGDQTSARSCAPVDVGAWSPCRQVQRRFLHTKVIVPASSANLRSSIGSWLDMTGAAAPCAGTAFIAEASAA